MKKLASTVSAALLVAVLAIGLATTGAADSEESDVDVTVSSETAIDVRPTSLSYSDELEPGTDLSESDDGFTAVELENIGSEDIGEVWASSTMPEETPFGTGDTEAYNTGNFIQIDVSTAVNGDYADGITDGSTDEVPHFVNRVEYSEDPAPTYIQTDAEEVVGADVEDATEEVGRFRAGDQEYFYVIYYDAAEGSGACSGGDDSVLLLGEDPHDPTTLGTVDFTDAENEDVSEEDITDIADHDEYGLVESLDLGDERYNTYTYCDPDPEEDELAGHTVRTRFNVDVASPDGEFEPGETTDATQTYLLETSDESNSLRPGESFPVDIGVQVPSGVAQGEIDNGSMTIFANQLE